MSIIHRKFRRPSRSMAVSLLALFVTTAGVASAAIPDAGGTIHGCYVIRSGALRVIDTQTNPPGVCTSGKEIAISWNQQGVAGSPGATGASGASITATYVRRYTTIVETSGTVTCDAGDTLTGGGANSNGAIQDAFPYFTTFQTPTSMDPPVGYSATRTGGTSLTVYAICVDSAP